MSLRKKFSKWFGWAQVPQKNSSNSGKVVEEIYHLVDYMNGLLSIPHHGVTLKKTAADFFKLGEEEMIRRLPELYLNYEQYLTEIDPQINFSKKSLRAKIHSAFPHLMAQPGFGFIFQKPYDRELVLCRYFLEAILSDTINALGKTEDNFFPITKEWISSLPNPSEQYPFFSGISKGKEKLTDQMVEISLVICNKLERKMGVVFVHKLYDQAYEQIAQLYKYLESFPIIISLIPKKYLDTEKVGLLSKHQLANALLEKVSYLEELNIQLGQRNAELYEAQVKLQRAQKSSEDSFLLLKEVMNAVKDGIIAANDKSEIVMINREVEKIWGYSEDDLIGQPMTNLMTESFRERHLNDMNRYLDKGTSEFLYRNLIMKGIRKDGTEFPIEINISDLQYGGQHLFTAVVRDITERLKFENDLRDSKKELELRTQALEKTRLQLVDTIAELQESNDDLEKFAYAASHDLQEPLRTVQGYLQLIQRIYLDENKKREVGEFTDFAIEGAERMQKLIQDLLEYSRVGRKLIHPQVIDLDKVMELIKHNLKGILEQKNGTLRYESFGTINVDKTQMIQLFQNLISNALKFSRPTVDPVIHIKLEEREKDLLFAVKDNGLGIAKEYQQRIFELFQRLHSNHEIPGSGIGLSICKKIVERHGGNIWVQSVEGEGTTFYFTLKKLEVFEPA